MKSLRSSGDALRRFDVKYFGASVDSVETNTDFAKSLGLDFPILSDPTRATARAYGVLAPSGFASRWTFYIGVDGRIAAIDRQVRAATHGTEVVDRLKTMQVPER